MGLPNISLTTYVYLLSQAIPLALMLLLTTITIFLTIFLVVLYRRKKFTFSPYFIFLPLLALAVLIVVSYQDTLSFSSELKEVWTEDTVTANITVQNISKQTPVIHNEAITSNKGVFLNIRNEWYFKTGKKYEITYYPTSKVIADVNKIEGELY